MVVCLVHMTVARKDVTMAVQTDHYSVQTSADEKDGSMVVHLVALMGEMSAVWMVCW